MAVFGARGHVGVSKLVGESTRGDDFLEDPMLPGEES